MNLKMFCELQESDWLSVIALRFCQFTDRTTLIEDDKHYWLKDRETQIFNLRGNEELFRIESTEADVQAKKVFRVPNNLFFQNKIEQKYFKVEK